MRASANCGFRFKPAIAILAGLLVSSAPAVAVQDSNRAVIEGSIKAGVEFAKAFGDGLTFKLTPEESIWSVQISHSSAPTRDLIYPVNPPFRFSNHLRLGPGAGESAKDSARRTPRAIAFLFRPADIEKAVNALERILWPSDAAGEDSRRATAELFAFPTGKLQFEILSAEFGPDERALDAKAAEEVIRSLKFRATITWPKTSGSPNDPPAGR